MYELKIYFNGLMEEINSLIGQSVVTQCMRSWGSDFALIYQALTVFITICYDQFKSTLLAKSPQSFVGSNIYRNCFSKPIKNRKNRKSPKMARCKF